jgi:isoleucyl-tRNA synthetase
MDKYFPETSPQVNFPKLEEEILAFWKENDLFKRSISQRKEQGAKDYVFYDGPPFATGLPHYGHILTSYIKDTIPRLFTMKGFAVDRRWGWDCHGLPIEYEIEKELEISGKQQIEAYGVDKFNARCAQAVTRYTKDWERIITRLGRWVDFSNDYKTMDLNYMESIMRVFHDLWEQDLIYQGEKVVAYCYRCQTPLSNFEARQDDSFRPRQDPSVTVRFQLTGDYDVPTYIMAWTTTPWTLPSNVMLAVGADIDYQRMRLDGEDYWIASSRVETYKKILKKAEVLETIKGSQLVGLQYKPLFPYFADTANGFKVYPADFVTTEDGTGIVHCAPAFGEEDFKLGQTNNVAGPNPVDNTGCFSEAVTDFAGQLVHDANPEIIKYLKRTGQLVQQQTLDHNYPHCWRDDTPLIYRSINTWYLNVTKVKERMLANNQKINWIPSHIRDGRFGKWLENAIDWPISRNRYFGAPIPIWRCDKSGEFFVPESLQELSDKWGQPVTDLHRPFIDNVTFPSPAGGTFRRVDEVLDCWFESGSMPYAQVHYPFENKQWFEDNFPADFIVEYIAQTRGWFYTMVVLSSALKNCPPFSNCICHGVVLGEDGRKLSKRLKNYPDPMEVADREGSDAMRIYLLASSVVRGGNIRVSEQDIKEVLRTYLIPVWNAYHFFATYANIAGWKPEAIDKKSVARVDRYILAKLEVLKRDVGRVSENYDIPSGYEAIRDFIEILNNWFIRQSRRRFWGEADAPENRVAYTVLYHVLKQTTLVMAPFIPFVAEALYRGLSGDESVHLQDWPDADDQWRDDDLVRRTDQVRSIASLGRRVRELRNIRVRQPLSKLYVSGVEEELLTKFENEIKTELNVKDLFFEPDPSKHVQVVIKPNGKALGPRLGKAFPTVLKAARDGEYELQDDGTVTVAGETLSAEEFDLEYVATSESEGCAAQGALVVVLSLEITRELLLEGMARDLIRAIQDARKRLNLAYTDRIKVTLSQGSENLADVVKDFGEMISSETLATKITFGKVIETNDRTTEAELAEEKVTFMI